MKGCCWSMESARGVFYNELRTMSDRMRTHFEADPEDKTDDAIKGRELIKDMLDLLKATKRKH